MSGDDFKKVVAAAAHKEKLQALPEGATLWIYVEKGYEIEARKLSDTAGEGMYVTRPGFWETNKWTKRTRKQIFRYLYKDIFNEQRKI